MKLRAMIAIAIAASSLTACGPAPTPPPPPPDPDWQLVMDGLPGALLRVWGTRSDDVYAVGANGDGSGALAFHYDGQLWKRLAAGTQDDLWWVQGVAADDVRMVGKNGTVLRYTPSSGAIETRHAPDGTTLFGAWGCAANDVWYVGGRPSVGHGVLWRDDGSAIRAPAVTASSTAASTVFKVFGFGCDDVWAVGQHGLALHWNGTRYDHPPPAPITGFSLFAVHGPSRDRLYAVGGAAGGVILAWNGSLWQDESPDGLPQMNGVWTTPDGTAYAAGYNGHIYKRDPAMAIPSKAAWTELGTTPRGSTLRVSFKNFHAVWVDEKNEIWAVGGDLANDPPKEGMLVHYGVPISTTVSE